MRVAKAVTMVAMVGALLVVASLAGAWTGSTQVRAAAVLTAAEVTATSMTQPVTGAKAVIVDADFTLGQLTSASVSVAQPQTTTTGSAYFVDTTDVLSMTTDGKFRKKFPASLFQTGEPFAISAKGIGTVTSSSLTLYMRLE